MAKRDAVVERVLWRVTGNGWREKSGGMFSNPLGEALCEPQEESAVIDTQLQKGS